jgi:hypothetical protein
MPTACSLASNTKTERENGLAVHSMLLVQENSHGRRNTKTGGVLLA